MQGADADAPNIKRQTTMARKGLHQRTGEIADVNVSCSLVLSVNAVVLQLCFVLRSSAGHLAVARLRAILFCSQHPLNGQGKTRRSQVSSHRSRDSPPQLCRLFASIKRPGFCRMSQFSTLSLFPFALILYDLCKLASRPTGLEIGEDDELTLGLGVGCVEGFCWRADCAAGWVGFDNAHYLWNCGTGFQMLATVHF